MKNTKRFLSLVLVLTFLVSILAMTTNASDDIGEAIGIVDASGLRLRSGPSTGSSIVATALRDDYVVILDSEGEWYRVIYNLKEGYMHSDYLIVKERENVELGYGMVNCYLVNMRSKPNTSSSTAAQLSYGEKAYIIGFNCGWYKVIYDDTVGYIRSDLLDLTEYPYENTGSDNSPVYFRNGDPIDSYSSSSSSSSSYSAGEAIVAEAKEYLGVPYVWGGTTPYGFDCSGYVQYVMRECGYTIRRTASQQLDNGYYVAKSDLLPGDLVFFERTYAGDDPATHVGIYIGGGEFIHAGTSCVTISDLYSSYYIDHYYTARRVW